MDTFTEEDRINRSKGCGFSFIVSWFMWISIILFIIGIVKVLLSL
jgi:hypothetical protein